MRALSAFVLTASLLAPVAASATGISVGREVPDLMLYEAGTKRRQFVNVSDVAPTLYELLGVTAPETYKGVPQMPVTGNSFRSVLDTAIIITQLFDNQILTGFTRLVFAPPGFSVRAAVPPFVAKVDKRIETLARFKPDAGASGS